MLLTATDLYRADSSHEISSAPQQPLLYNNNTK